MKKFLTTILASSLSLGLAATAHAALDQEVVISKRNVLLNVDVSTAKVKLSNAGYATYVLKVLVPDLADVTLLDHRNEGESAPCIATYETLKPEDVIKNDPGMEKVKATITLNRMASLNPDTHLCEINLHESISTKVRGFLFIHDRMKVIATRNEADCR